MEHPHTPDAAAAAPAPHVLPAGLYVKIWAGLILLTIVTVVVSYFHFGNWNLFVAIAVATVKASLVALFFMHLKYDSRFNSAVLLVGLVFLAILIGLTMADTEFRGYADAIESQKARVLTEPFKNGRPDAVPAPYNVPSAVP